MPYSIPAPTPAPLPIHSQGRPGHRRSFSEFAYNGFNPANHTQNSMSSAPIAPPRMRKESSGAFEPLRALPTRRKAASFHLEADDDDDSSPEDEVGTNGGGSSSNHNNSAPPPAASTSTATARFSPPATPQHRRLSPNSSSATLTVGGMRPTLPGRPSTPQIRDDDEDEFSRPGLPPLKLKIPSNGALNLPFAGSPTRSGSPALPNLSSPSLPRSRSGSMDNIASLSAPTVNVKSPSPLSAPASQVAFPSTGSGANTPTSADSPRPQFPRTASTPSFRGSPTMQRTLSNSSITSTNDGRIILPNGRPLKSSLKSSSSSPNIPFPSQSLVPSRIYAEIAAKQARDREEQARAGTPTQEIQDHLRITGYPDVPLSNRHARAASAPALPSLLPTADSEPGSPTDMPQTPSAPKAVHFPESDDVATIKFFRRTARPASVSLPGASGDEGTETETDGEGYGSSTGNGGWGSGNSSSNAGTYRGYNANTSWGWGGYVNPWDRFTAAGSARQQASQSPAQSKGPGGYPFPRIAPPTRASSGKVPGTVQGAKREMGVQKRRVYGLERERTSVMPRRDLGLFDNVFLEGVDVSSSDVDSPSSNGEKKTRVTLTGSILVRNLAFEKHVSIRFTLDEWHTTSEVKALYKESLERLPERWVGVMRGDPSLADDTTRPQTLAPSTVPAINPQWDRFTFTVDLSDYARSRSLVNRTMWMVVRFATPGVVRVPIAVPLRTSAFNSSSASNAGAVKPQADVLGTSDGNMLSTIISGIAGAPHHSGAAQDRYMKGRQVVEELLRKRSVCIGGGVGSEWWDNNNGGNFRVVFTEREEIVGDVEPKDEAEGEKAGEDEEDGAQGRKRMNVVSCPPLLGSTPPPPMSILDKSLSHSALSPPQISVSTSLDSSSNFTPTANGTIPGTNSTSAPATPYGGGPTTNNGTPNPWPTRTPAASKALAETTLERLKRLNLRNYAAPSAPAKPAPLILPVPQSKPASSAGALSVPSKPANGDAKADGPPSRTSSTSSTASWASSNSSSSGSEVTPMTSPLVTPTIGSLVDEMPWLHVGVVGDPKSKVVEEKEDVLDDIEPVGRVTPRPTAIPIPPPSANLSALLSPLPISPMPGNPDREGPGSPTVSSSPETAMRAMTSPMQTFGNFMGEAVETGMSAMMGTSPPFSSLLGGGVANTGFGWAQRLGASKEDDKKEEDDDKTVVADGVVTPMAMPDVDAGVLPSKLLANIREKSTSVPGGLGGRRPGSPMPGSGKSSPVRAPSPPSEEKSRLSLVVDGVHAKTGSGSDSGSSATARSGSGGSGSSGSGHRKRHSHNHRHDPQGLGLTFKSPTSPTASPATSSFASSLAPRRHAPGHLSPLNGLSAPPVPFASPVSPSGPTSTAGHNSLDDIRDPDSIYQAFVKQWCFASGPAPAQAGGFGTMSGTGDKKGL